MNSGGAFRRWYGNRNSVIKFDKEHYDIITKNKGHRNPQFYFKKAAPWTKITSGKFSMRLSEEGFINNDASMAAFEKDIPLEIVVGLMNSVVAQHYLSLVNESLNYTSGNVASVPYALSENDIEYIKESVEQCISISKSDWDSFEVSWDFTRHPLISVISKNHMLFDDIDDIDLVDCFACWENECDERFERLKHNEEQLNKIFIDKYGLQNELIPEVEEKYVTVRKANLSRDIKSLISFAVGCMFGRYSLNEMGLAYAGGEFDSSKYTAFAADDDAIIPITDEEYFDDDIVTRFVEFIRTVYGNKSLESNLDYIAKALGNKGNTSREVIRNYFLNDFFKDHCSTYSVTGSGKRPIYWLFDSGKQNGFKCLIYMHRYNPDTVGLIRSVYLKKAQDAIEASLKNAEYAIANTESAVDRAANTRKRDKYIKQLAEIKPYYQALSHVAMQRIDIDLDDGVKVNYAKFQGIEVGGEGEKKQTIDLLSKI